MWRLITYKCNITILRWLFIRSIEDEIKSFSSLIITLVKVSIEKIEWDNIGKN